MNAWIILIKSLAAFTCFAIVWESIELYKQLKKWFTLNKLDSNKLYLDDPYSRMFKETMKYLFSDCWNKS